MCVVHRGIGFQPVISLDFDRLEAYPTSKENVMKS